MFFNEKFVLFNRGKGKLYKLKIKILLVKNVYY